MIEITHKDLTTGKVIFRDNQKEYELSFELADVFDKHSSFATVDVGGYGWHATATVEDNEGEFDLSNADEKLLNYINNSKEDWEEICEDCNGEGGNNANCERCKGTGVVG